MAKVEKKTMVCAECQRPNDEWTANKGKGVVKDGEQYCCEGCAEQGFCECEDMDADAGEGAA